MILVAVKRCPGCQTAKEANEFYKSARSQDGLQSRCKDCNRISSREFRRKKRASDPEEMKAKAAEWYAKNKDHSNATNRRWRQEHAAQLVEYRRQWRAEHPDYGANWRRVNKERHREAAKRWLAANPHKAKEYAQRYNKSHPEMLREQWRRKKARRKNVITLPFTASQLADRWAYYGENCWICREPAVETDHVKPLSKGGWHALSNLRPICHQCNMRKRDHWPMSAVHETFANHEGAEG